MVVASILVACIAYMFWNVPVPSTGDSDSPTSPDRIVVLDNAKAFCMAMVIWTHFIVYGSLERYQGVALSRALWFHMPVFCIISGMLSRKAFSWERLMRLLRSMVVPLVLYTLILSPLLKGFLAPVENVREQFAIMLQNPIAYLFIEIYPVWYLRCLVLWRLEAWTLDALPPRVQMIIVLQLGIFASYLDVGFDENLYTMPLMTCAKMGPFFFMGRIFGHCLVPRLESDSSKGRVLEMVCSCGALILWLICAVAAPSFASSDWLVEFKYPFRNYRALMAPSCPADALLLWSRYLADVIFRGIMAVVVLVFAMPRQRTVFTECGSLSIFPYLLHMHVLRFPLNGQAFGLWVHVEAFASNNLFVLLPLQLSLSVFLTCFLAAPPCRAAFGWALQPTWLPFSSTKAMQST
jgi:fucose 4-O-acetylase-like acetyltransferase